MWWTRRGTSMSGGIGVKRGFGLKSGFEEVILPACCLAACWAMGDGRWDGVTLTLLGCLSTRRCCGACVSCRKDVKPGFGEIHGNDRSKEIDPSDGRCTVCSNEVSCARLDSNQERRIIFIELQLAFILFSTCPSWQGELNPQTHFAQRHNPPENAVTKSIIRPERPSPTRKNCSHLPLKMHHDIVIRLSPSLFR